jgi:hypothetical protein
MTYCCICGRPDKEVGSINKMKSQWLQCNAPSQCHTRGTPFCVECLAMYGGLGKRTDLRNYMEKGGSICPFCRVGEIFIIKEL